MVDLEFQPDFHKILRRYEAWWQCELIDRPLVAMSVKPKRETPFPPKVHASIREKWFDIEYAIELAAEHGVGVFVQSSEQRGAPSRSAVVLDGIDEVVAVLRGLLEGIRD